MEEIEAQPAAATKNEEDDAPVHVRTASRQDLVDYISTTKHVRIPTNLKPSTLTPAELDGIRKMSVLLTPRKDR
jgi:hypothetical protein